MLKPSRLRRSSNPACLIPAQPGLFPREHVGDPLVLFACHRRQARRLLHLRL